MRRYLFAASSMLLACGYLVAQEAPFATGLQFLDPGQYAGIPLSAPSFAGPLPEQVDVAPFATAGNQGRQGSCVGWAVAFALKTHQEEVERGWGVSTADHQFSPSFVYNQIKRGTGCLGGTTFPDALNILTRDGAATLADFPYDESRCDQIPTATTKQRAAPFRVATWRRVNTLDEVELKTHLADGFPVLIGMPVDRAFMDITDGSIYQGLTGSSLGGHAMVVTGYDDAKGAFRLLNSWGSSWADGGRGWISYGGFRSTVREGYVVQDIVVAGANAPVQRPQLDLETIVLAEVPAGTRSATNTTGDHHCSLNCAGEPTRTNYVLSLVADEGATLRNPKIRCVAGPCHGWNAVLFVRLENEDRRALASWDVWTEPMTWELTADQVRIGEVSRFSRRVDVGMPFTVVAATTGPPPRITGRFPTGETFSLIVGQPTLNPRLRLLDFEVQGPETVYRYEAR